MASFPDFPEQLARLREGPVEGPRWGASRLVAMGAVLAAVLVVVVAAALFALRPSPPGEVLPAAASPPAPFVAAPVPAATVSPVPPSAASGAPGARVYVVGQVREPGVVTLPAGARVEDAVEAAGGATGRADLTVINLARPVQDGEQILVPKPGESPAPAPIATAAPSGSGPAGAPAGPINLNTATAADLDSLPGVGPVIAQRIVDWRQQNGGFTSVDDLGEVSGIGDATLGRLRPLVTV
jgi:competence protein ComEA